MNFKLLFVMLCSYGLHAAMVAPVNQDVFAYMSESLDRYSTKLNNMMRETTSVRETASAKKFFLFSIEAMLNAKFIDYCASTDGGPQSTSRRIEGKKIIEEVQGVGVFYNTPALYTSDSLTYGNIVEISSAFFTQSLLQKISDVSIIIVIPYMYLTYLRGQKILTAFRDLIDTFNMSKDKLEQMYRSTMLVFSMDPNEVEFGVNDETISMQLRQLSDSSSVDQEVKTYIQHLLGEYRVTYFKERSRQRSSFDFSQSSASRIMSRLETFDSDGASLKSMCISHDALGFLQTKIRQLCESYASTHGGIINGLGNLKADNIWINRLCNYSSIEQILLKSSKKYLPSPRCWLIRYAFATVARNQKLTLGISVFITSIIIAIMGAVRMYRLFLSSYYPKLYKK